MVGGAKHLWIIRHTKLLLREMAQDGLYPVAYRYNCEVKTLMELAVRHRVQTVPVDQRELMSEGAGWWPVRRGYLGQQGPLQPPSRGP